MGGLPRLARVYIATITIVAVLANLIVVPYLPLDVKDTLSLVIFTVAAFIAQLFPISLPRVRSAYFTISTAINIAVVIIFGPAAAMWSALVSTFLGKMIGRKPWPRVLFNASQYSLTYGLAGIAYRAIWPGPPLANLWPAIPAIFALSAVYFLVNTGCVFLIISVVDRIPFLRLWRSSVRRIIIHDITMVAVGLVFSILWTYNIWSIPLVIPFVLVLYQSMSAVGKMEQQTKDALFALGRVIDRRDCQTFAHSERVAEYVVWLCDELGLAADETEVITYAARLHDLGKVGVPDGLLLKPGKLTPEEESQFRRHPDVGADIIAQFPIFREGTEIVRHEHEWYNGEGYPTGLRGEAIPLGSRIIAVADAYEAMMSDRPYRKALGREIAVEQLQRGRGTQFDPKAVDAFIDALRKRQLVESHASSTTEQPSPLPASELFPARTDAANVDVGHRAMRA